MSKESPNVIVKIYNYRPNGNNEYFQKKRDFYSCKSKDNYVGYIQKGINQAHNIIEYVGNSEKSFGLFNQNGIMTKEQISELRNNLRETKSVIWDGLISFKSEFGQIWCNSFEQAYNLMQKELPKFFENSHFNKDNMVWFAGLHENTKQRHIHFCFYEKEPIHFRKKNNAYGFSDGRIPNDKILSFKGNIENAVTDTNSEIYKIRDDAIKVFKGELDSQKLYNKLLSLADKFPTVGRLSYDSENMKDLKYDVDDISNYIISKKKKIDDDLTEFLILAKKKDDVMKSYIKRNKVNYNYQSFYKTYSKDFYRRIGNLVISKAKELKDNDNARELKITKSKQQKYAKKQSLMDDILGCMYLSEQVDKESIKCFEDYQRNMQRIEYEIKKEQGSYNRDFEM